MNYDSQTNQYTCPKCGSHNIVSVQYSYTSPQAYDGISEYWCHPGNGGCGYREGRWTGFELKDGELEPRLGQITVKRNGKWRTENAAKPVQVGADV